MGRSPSSSTSEYQICKSVFGLKSSPDLHSPPTTANLLALALAPIQSYLSILTLLAIPSYIPLLSLQPYTTRLAIGQAVVSSVLKNNTLIETPEDVSGVLGLCAVLVRDQKDPAGGSRQRVQVDHREMAEEQGWVARMVHLFKSDNLETQFEVSYSGQFRQQKLMFSCCKLPEDTLLRAERGYDTRSLL